MATTLTANVTASVSWNYASTVAGDRSAIDAAAINHLVELVNGTGSNQCDIMWQARRSLGNGASDTFDLAGGLTNSFGAAITFAKVKLFFVRNLEAGVLEIGGATNDWYSWLGASGDKAIVPGYGVLLTHSPLGFAVQANLGDQLKIRAATATQYDVVLMGSTV